MTSITRGRNVEDLLVSIFFWEIAMLACMMSSKAKKLLEVHNMLLVWYPPSLEHN
jgi:hypothetical protein